MTKIVMYLVLLVVYQHTRYFVYGCKLSTRTVSFGPQVWFPQYCQDATGSSYFHCTRWAKFVFRASGKFHSSLRDVGAKLSATKAGAGGVPNLVWSFTRYVAIASLHPPTQAKCLYRRDSSVAFWNKVQLRNIIFQGKLKIM